ncbi:MAG: hypothetical protein A2Z99_10070 [Treponema sp. GWB1_62_6]|nr:MAG: hypothetical protein A2Y36_00280 [Treponema sp. GWA1_62_8]OHE66388.1 MAG: hypothetical protein A2Z99_10070 [Treponema sp. GWB1_62_6]OHE66752.1 MAG: hypothetical protein A2001_02435 [Treponema sp. GWC1_61_84]
MEQNTLRRAFDLLENDAASLDARRLAWETIVDGNSKWVLIKGFPIPAGYNVSEAEIALMLPESYPTTQIDMVYVSPALSLVSNAPIGALCTEVHDGRNFQRWSRHRTAINQWRPDIDDLGSHLSLVEEWFLKETKKNG